jgi:hypothetical protein
MLGAPVAGVVFGLDVEDSALGRLFSVEAFRQ